MITFCSLLLPLILYFFVLPTLFARSSSFQFPLILLEALGIFSNLSSQAWGPAFPLLVFFFFRRPPLLLFRPSPRP